MTILILLTLHPFHIRAVVPILMQGMQQLAKERPEDPVAWIADFLKKNNPKKRKADAM